LSAEADHVHECGLIIGDGRDNNLHNNQRILSMSRIAESLPYYIWNYLTIAGKWKLSIGRRNNANKKRKKQHVTEWAFFYCHAVGVTQYFSNQISNQKSRLSKVTWIIFCGIHK